MKETKKNTEHRDSWTAPIKKALIFGIVLTGLQICGNNSHAIRSYVANNWSRIKNLGVYHLKLGIAIDPILNKKHSIENSLNSCMRDKQLPHDFTINPLLVGARGYQYPDLQQEGPVADIKYYPDKGIIWQEQTQPLKIDPNTNSPERRILDGLKTCYAFAYPGS